MKKEKHIYVEHPQATINNAQKRLLDSIRSSYRIDVVCKNCGSESVEGVNKGVPVSHAESFLRCNVCGCQTLKFTGLAGKKTRK